MYDRIVSAILLIVGVVNVIPLIAFFDIRQTLRLYGLTVEGEDLVLLTRHRGVLLAIVGIALIAAAFRPELRLLAISLALLSKIAFLFLALSIPNHTIEIRQVALIDVAAVVLLLIAGGVHMWAPQSR
jgi:hypothetical protein